MEINTEGRAGTALPGQSEHGLTEVRQGRWLYELEQALLLRSDKKPVAAERARADVSEEAMTPEPEAGDSKGAGDATTWMPAAAGGGNGAPQSAAVAAPAAAARAAAGEAASAALATSTTSAPPLASTGGGLAPVGVAMAVAAQQMMIAMPMVSLAAYVSASGTGQRAADEGVAGGVQPLYQSTPVMMAGLSWTLPPAGDEAALPTPELAAPDEASSSAPAVRDQEPADDYASRLMHVYQGADGVQAWVRDAGIGAAQSLLLARGMADELSSAGSRLSELTVNGKKILSSSDNQPINLTGAV